MACSIWGKPDNWWAFNIEVFNGNAFLKKCWPLEHRKHHKSCSVAWLKSYWSQWRGIHQSEWPLYHTSRVISLYIDRGEVKMFIANPSKARRELVMNQLFIICTAQSVAFFLYEFSLCRGCAYCLWDIKNNSSLHHHSYFAFVLLYTYCHSTEQDFCVGHPLIMSGNKLC